MTTDVDLELGEDELRALLAEAADAAPPPGRAPEDLLARLVETAGEGGGDDGGDGDPTTPVPLWRRRPSPKLVGLAAAAVLVLAVLGATLATGDSHHTTPTGGDKLALVPRDASVPSTTIAPPNTGGDAAVGTTGGAAASSAPESLASGSVAGPFIPAPAPTPPATIPALTPTDSAKVVKTGSLDLQVRKGAFDSAMSAITAKVTGLGGYVADSTTASSDAAHSGTITVRVPANSFDQLLSQLRGLGTVRGQTEKGTEVTAQYTDLQARLTAETATRDRLNAVLSKANNVSDILSVQDRITDVQTQIEQLQGQLRVLDDQTAMGTLAVSISEPGAKPVVVPNPDDRTLRTAFQQARHRFGNGIEAVIAWSGGAAAVLLVMAVVAGLAWIAWRGRRRWLL